MARTEIDLVCPTCDEPFSMELAQYNHRINRQGCRAVYCSRKCSGIGRRSNKTHEQKTEEKRLYDIEYREKNLEKIKKHKAKVFRLDYKANPEKYRLERLRRKEEHQAYIQTPKYKAWKKKYDRKHRAKKTHGEYWESLLLVLDIGIEVDKYEAMITKGTLNKSTKRKRGTNY